MEGFTEVCAHVSADVALAVGALLTQVREYATPFDEDPACAFMAPEQMIALWKVEHRSKPATSHIQRLSGIIDASSCIAPILEHLETKDMWLIERLFKNYDSSWYDLLAFDCLVTLLPGENPNLLAWIDAHPKTWTGHYVAKQ